MTKKLPTRDQVKTSDCWDLSSLFANNEAWDKAFKAWEAKIDDYKQFQGKLGDGPEVLAKCLTFDEEMEQAGEQLGVYAFLKITEDAANGESQALRGRFSSARSKVAQAAAYISPEIMAIPKEKMDTYLKSDALAHFKLMLERVLRYRPHTLSDEGERLMAMQLQPSQTPYLTFHQLNDADLEFGSLKNAKGEEVALTHASFSTFLESPNRDVRRNAFHQFYKEYEAHENTFAATLAGVVHQDVFTAQARNFKTSLESSLFPDHIPVSVVDNLVDSVHRHLEPLYKYFDIRRRVLGVEELHFYDTYVPIIPDVEKRIEWNEAVDMIVEALKPLGKEYTDTLGKGLRGRWCDRYENQGKQPGAFSCSAYKSVPFILMNYQPKVLDHVFTLAHEGGHSMHSHFSSENQTYTYHDYVLFVAEVASIFNEEMLGEYLMSKAETDKERAYLINRRLNNIRLTVFRQTMFSEFEREAHRMAEAGEALTCDAMRAAYAKLLRLYHGPKFAIDDQLSLECFRIPHFYRNFYVYKYATGMSAAMALASKVRTGGSAELKAYLNFLSAGCSKDPLDLLRDAGVDMETPGAVDAALGKFADLVDQLDKLV
jgi:oligoendopeptidase F